METVKIEIEIPKPSDWEICALKRLMQMEYIAHDDLIDGHTPAKASWLNRLLCWGAIAQSLPAENGKPCYIITTFGQELLRHIEALHE